MRAEKEKNIFDTQIIIIIIITIMILIIIITKSVASARWYSTGY